MVDVSFYAESIKSDARHYDSERNLYVMDMLFVFAWNGEEQPGDLPDHVVRIPSARDVGAYLSAWRDAYSSDPDFSRAVFVPRITGVYYTGHETIRATRSGYSVTRGRVNRFWTFKRMNDRTELVHTLSPTSYFNGENTHEGRQLVEYLGRIDNRRFTNVEVDDFKYRDSWDDEWTDFDAYREARKTARQRHPNGSRVIWTINCSPHGFSQDAWDRHQLDLFDFRMAFLIDQVELLIVQSTPRDALSFITPPHHAFSSRAFGMRELTPVVHTGAHRVNGEVMR